MVTSGPIESITISGRRFSTDEGDDTSIQLGGFKNEVKTNGDGTNRLVKSRVPATIDGVSVQIDEDRDDFSWLKEKQDSLDMLDVSVTDVAGAVYSGSMQITDEIPYSKKNGTAKIKLAGTCEKQG